MFTPISTAILVIVAKLWNQPANRQMERENGNIYTVECLLLGAWKQRNSDTCDNRVEPWKNNDKWNNPLIEGKLLHTSI